MGVGVGGGGGGGVIIVHSRCSYRGVIIVLSTHWLTSLRPQNILIKPDDKFKNKNKK